jgi:Ca2+/H+ antiporter, TMEM165/GDT1 family
MLANVNLVQMAPAVAAAFLASLVEFVEALTIVLAVGTVRGWRPAVLGAAAGAVVLAILVAVAGPALGRVPIAYLQVLVGALLLLFGLSWLRKAVRRAVGLLPLHDELKAFAEETEVMAATPRRDGEPAWWDTIAVAATFKAMLLEGLEVVFIVIAVGSAGNLMLPASLGAAVAGLLVLLAGLALHRPLARVPENSLKWAVGILLSAFGIFWLGEGLGLPWPGEDLAILGLAGALFAGSLAIVAFARNRPVRAQP